MLSFFRWLLPLAYNYSFEIPFLEPFRTHFERKHISQFPTHFPLASKVGFPATDRTTTGLFYAFQDEVRYLKDLINQTLLFEQGFVVPDILYQIYRCVLD